MLVLSRRKNETIDCTIDLSEYLAGNEVKTDIPIRIEVLDVKGGQVRIGISAPEAVKIVRSEIARDPR